MKEEKEEKQNKYIKFIKSLYKSKRGRAILFFGFYFIFFFVVISLIRTNYHSSPNITSIKDNNVKAIYELKKIENGNYHFIREENINGLITNFTGDKNANRIEGIMTSNNMFYNYFIYDNINLIKLTDKYEITNDLYHFNDITEDNNISKFLEKAYLVSKTEYETGNTIYNYEITTNTIDALINNTNIDIADIPNKIILETNQEDEVVKITYDLTSYATYLNKAMTTITITISYSNFGEIANIEIPKR